MKNTKKVPLNCPRCKYKEMITEKEALRRRGSKVVCPDCGMEGTIIYEQSPA